MPFSTPYFTAIKVYLELVFNNTARFFSNRKYLSPLDPLVQKFTVSEAPGFRLSALDARTRFPALLGAIFEGPEVVPVALTTPEEEDAASSGMNVVVPSFQACAAGTGFWRLLAHFKMCICLGFLPRIDADSSATLSGAAPMQRRASLLHKTKDLA